MHVDGTARFESTKSTPIVLVISSKSIQSPKSCDLVDFFFPQLRNPNLPSTTTTTSTRPTTTRTTAATPYNNGHDDGHTTTTTTIIVANDDNEGLEISSPRYIFLNSFFIYTLLTIYKQTTCTYCTATATTVASHATTTTAAVIPLNRGVR